MTFCEYYKDCIDGSKCARALTDEVKEGATKWWGNKDVPICVYVTPPDCYKPQTRKG